MNKETVHIFYATDENYLDYVAVALGSALMHASDIDRIVVDVLTLGIDDEVWRKWHEETCRHLPIGSRVIQHKVDESRFSGFKQWHGSMATYARLIIPELMPELAWCVYADVDTLFTDDPIKLALLFDDKYAIMGHLEKTLKGLDAESHWFKSRDLPFDKQKYFCAGFVLMNLDLFRKEKYGDRCLQFLQDHPDVKLPDQDALNAVCLEKVGTLPYGWGAFGCEAFAEGRPGAIHYPGHNPWRFLDVMFPDYIDAWNVWFRYAHEIYGKDWKFYIRKPPRYIKYYRMRILGGVFSLLRYILTTLNLLRFPVVGRYLNRHYASYRVWREIRSCL